MDEDEKPRHGRRYNRRQKLTVVLAADMTSTEAASEASGVPRSTLRRWINDPEWAELRQNAREMMAEEALVVARMAWLKLGEAIKANHLEPRDLVLAAGMATDKSQLLNGAATARSETRDLTGTIGDAELVSAIREAESLVAVGGGPEASTAATEG